MVRLFLEGAVVGLALGIWFARVMFRGERRVAQAYSESARRYKVAADAAFEAAEKATINAQRAVAIAQEHSA